jgi:hypothetical protein
MLKSKHVGLEEQAGRQGAKEQAVGIESAVMSISSFPE